MFDYLQKFNKLPKDLRSKISEKEVMSKVSELEKKYQVDLAALIMKVMVKQIPYKNIALYLVGEKDLNEKKAEELSQKLKENIFKDVSNYLDDDKERSINNKNESSDIEKLQEVDNKEDPQELINEITKKEDHNIKIDSVTDDIISKANINLSSSYLFDRLHMVLRTYIKGVRDKIATRSTLSRSGQEGGLSLDDASIDKVLKLADEYKKSQEPEIEKPKPKVSEEAEKRDKLEALNENYDLKESIKLKEEEIENKNEDKSNKEKEEIENKEKIKEEKDKKDEKDEKGKSEGIEEFNKKSKKEDLYKKLHIKREIAPPNPRIITDKDKNLVDTYKEDKSKEQNSEDYKNKEEELKEDREKENQEELKKEKEQKDKEKHEEHDKEIAKKVDEVDDKEDKNNKEANKDNNDNKEIEEKAKKEDDKKKKLEINNLKENEANDNIKEVSQENKNSISNNLSQAPVSSGKKSMQDIKVNNRIMGPIDELRYFNLKNFRRLSPDPEEAFARIKDKIDLLAKESYEKKIEGIQAWRENPLNKLYHQVSIESLSKSKPISEVLKQRQENNMDYLSSEELKALVAFNKSYMF